MKPILLLPIIILSILSCQNINKEQPQGEKTVIDTLTIDDTSSILIVDDTVVEVPDTIKNYRANTPCEEFIKEFEKLIADLEQTKDLETFENKFDWKNNEASKFNQCRKQKDFEKEFERLNLRLGDVKKSITNHIK